MPCQISDSLLEDPYVELTLDEIFNGFKAGFPGLLPAILGYLETIGCNRLVIGRIQSYLALLAGRAAGTIPTTAQFLRSRYKSHPDYKQDGIITPAMADDVLVLCDAIGKWDAASENAQLCGTAHIEDLNAATTYLFSHRSSLPSSNIKLANS